MSSRQPMSGPFLALLIVVVAVSGSGGCGQASSTSNMADRPTRRYFVDVSNGQMITAHTIGREPIIIRKNSALPKMPERKTLADERDPKTSTKAPMPDFPADDDEDALAQVTNSGGNNGSAGNRNIDQAPASSPLQGAIDEPPSLTEASVETAPLPTFDASAFRNQVGANPDGGVVWSILLKSITAAKDQAQTQGMQHQQLAAVSANAFIANEPDLRGGIWLNSSEKGTMILYGRYRSVDDQQAQSDLKFVKDITVQGKNPYATAYLVRIDLSRANEGALHPHDLRALRKKYPKVDPMYTIDVASWVTPDDDPDGRTFAANAKAAEAYAAQLRQRGIEAYFYHNRNTRISSVTVGKFDRTAINDDSGLYASTVREIMDMFPSKLVNGEPIVNSQTGKAQPPNMVEVPMKLE